MRVYVVVKCQCNGRYVLGSWKEKFDRKANYERCIVPCLLLLLVRLIEWCLLCRWSSGAAAACIDVVIASFYNDNQMW